MLTNFIHQNIINTKKYFSLSDMDYLGTYQLQIIKKKSNVSYSHTVGMFFNTFIYDINKRRIICVNPVCTYGDIVPRSPFMTKVTLVLT